MPTRNVNLTDHLDTFIEDNVGSGRFSNASEVVREALRLLEQREAEERAKLAWLRTTTQESIASMDRGEGTTFQSLMEFETFLDQTLEELTALHPHG